MDEALGLDGCVLFRVITGMSEYPKVEMSPHTIAAGNRNAMFPCIDELFIKKDLPLCVYEFTMAMCHECRAG
jgi:hypothetical protein